jgi:hypothetical protein
MDILVDVVGYEGLYKINKNGEVWSKRNKFLKIGVDIYGYNYVKLSKKGKPKNYTIHRLIAINFIPNPDNLPQIDHIDGNKTNNTLENLRWVTASTNQQNKRKGIRNTSGYYNIGTTNNKGVSYWRISFEKDKKVVYSKCFQKSKVSLEQVVAIRDEKYIEFGIVKYD